MIFHVIVDVDLLDRGVPTNPHRCMGTKIEGRISFWIMWGFAQRVDDVVGIKAKRIEDVVSSIEKTRDVARQRLC